MSSVRERDSHLGLLPASPFHACRWGTTPLRRGARSCLFRVGDLEIAEEPSFGQQSEWSRHRMIADLDREERKEAS
jgi:hypothetical protein